MPNVACNYKAFRKKLEAYSNGPEELSKLLQIEVSYKPSKKPNNTVKSKKERALSILRNNLCAYITDTEKLEAITQSVYTELQPVMSKTK